ncbi:MAG: transcriptional regulator GcvA [Paracoccaceae bacterium]
MARRLPPLNALRAFEAAARHQSFKRAAEELNVTPAAISQQIRSLEDHLGTPLFERLTRALRLTEAGRAGLGALTDGFDRLAEGVEAIRADAQPGVITVSVAPSFASKWLVPRLDRLREAEPDLDIRIDATDTPADFHGDGVDLAIRYGRGRYPGLEVERLLDEVSFPVASPALVTGDPPLRTPSDLASHTLLHVVWTMEQDAAPNWRMWLKAAGVRGVDGTRGPRFSVDSLALGAAIAGQGVALSGRALAAEDLEAGRLVRPFLEQKAQSTAFSYFLVYPSAKRAAPKVQAFRNWVITEAARAREASALL